MKIAIIVATGLNNEIGKNNQLLWHLPADLKFFKTTTLGCPIIMGRKTFESIGRILPGRKNIVISRNQNFVVPPEAFLTKDINTAIEIANHETVFIIGGAEIYKMALPLVREIYRTLVKSNFDADTFFPEINTNEFNLVWEENHLVDEKNKMDYSFQKWVRKY